MENDEMFETYSILRRIGKEVRKKADQGHKLSMDLMIWYELHYKCQGDPGARAFVTDLTMKWCEEFPDINLRTWKALEKRSVKPVKQKRA